MANEERTGKAGVERGKSGPRVAEVPDITGLRVLVVEDHTDTLDLLRVILENCGASVTTAASASEALDVLNAGSPTCWFRTWLCPSRMVRVDSQGALSRPDRGGNIPAVALTAYTRAEDRTRALAAGFQQHLSKPIDPEELISVLVSVLR